MAGDPRAGDAAGGERVVAKRKPRYEFFNDGKAVVLEPDENLRFRCCDCGLVHLIDVAVKPGKRVALTLWREQVRTAASRRARTGYLLQPGGVGRWRMVRKRK